MKDMRIRIGDYFSDFFIKGWNLDIDKELEVEYVDAGQFLKSQRIDLVCKLFYIECREKHQNEDFAKELYKAHIKAFSFGSFTEPGSEEKNTIEKYFATFNALIDNVKTHGLDAKESVVPIGDNNSILDGSHRTAIAIYYKLELPIVKIDGINKIYDYEFFQGRGLDNCYLDYMAYLYVLYHEHSYIACLWPRADLRNKIKRTEQLIEQVAGIVYKKRIKFNYHGLQQLMIHIYGNQEWAGSIEDDFKGIPFKAQKCYRNMSFTTVYVLSGCNLDKMVDLKSRIREIFEIENHSIHITDTKKEAIEAAQVLLFKESVYLLNYGNIMRDKSLIMEIMKQHVKNNIDERWLNTDSIKTLYGLCDYKQKKECYSIHSSIGAGFINYGYIFGERFTSLKEDELTFRDKVLLRFNKLKYGAVVDMISNLQIKNRIRHIGGVILRRIRVIR